MRKNYFLAFIAFALLICFDVKGQSQSDDPVLFSVEGKPVKLSEFDYIYNKTSSGQSDFSMSSVREYLDLYIKFKLKVQKAREMELDTVRTLARELEGYRRQLADTYLIDKEVTEKLIEEAYDRKKREREVWHILVAFKDGEDSSAVRNKAKSILSMVSKGADFEQMALGQSDDPNVSKNNGYLGYRTALMPNGFYDLETAIFTTPIGEVHNSLIESPMGLHIIKVTDERPASGEIEVAHILVRDPASEAVKGAEAKINKAWEELEKGRYFEEVAMEYSEDRITMAKGGYLGFFGINRYEDSFEKAAFSLEENGTYSKPFRTSLGWHIVKRINKKDLEPLSVIRPRIQNQVKQSDRFQIERQKMIEDIKRNGGFAEFDNVLEQFIQELDEDFLTYKYQGESDMKNEVLFIFNKGDYKQTVGDFIEYVMRNQRKRLQMSRTTELETAVRNLYEDFVNESSIKYEESKLEVKYPEFRALMREYEEGILLFEATKIHVWDKASEDEEGLKAFHEANKESYMWGERAVVVNYELKDVNDRKASKIHKYAVKRGHEKALKKYNKRSETVVANVVRYEKAQKDKMGDIPWEEGYVSAFGDGDRSFVIVEEILPPQPKKLSEARGYIIADYQDYLEKQWVKSLKEKYSVEVNEDILAQYTRS